MMIMMIVRWRTLMMRMTTKLLLLISCSLDYHIIIIGISTRIIHTYITHSMRMHFELCTMTFYFSYVFFLFAVLIVL